MKQPDLDRVDVAVCAVWRMFKQGKIEQLESVGITRDKRDVLDEMATRLPTKLRRAAGTRETPDGYVLESEINTRHVKTLIRECPFVLDAAAQLLARYSEVESR